MPSPQSYRQSDPERQEFVKLSQNAERQVSIGRELALRKSCFWNLWTRDYRAEAELVFPRTLLATKKILYHH